MAFCAYHGSVTFFDIGHVIYTVEPYQNIPACNVPGFSDELELSTASSLSHEFFESQTDPDPDTGYTASSGDEIGDECRILYENVQLGPGNWLIQMEYSNTYHACADGP